jgi:hypothetical protein
MAPSNSSRYREGRTACIDYVSLPKYRQLRLFYNPDKSLEQYIPKGYLERRLHDDPEFDTFTVRYVHVFRLCGMFQEYCIGHPRAANLKKLDHLFFLARLVRWGRGGFSKEMGFYLIGFFEIELILNDVVAKIDQAKGHPFYQEVGLRDPVEQEGHALEMEGRLYRPSNHRISYQELPDNGGWPEDKEALVLCAESGRMLT